MESLISVWGAGCMGSERCRVRQVCVGCVGCVCSMEMGLRDVGCMGSGGH